MTYDNDHNHCTGNTIAFKSFLKIHLIITTSNLPFDDHNPAHLTTTCSTTSRCNFAKSMRKKTNLPYPDHV